MAKSLKERSAGSLPRVKPDPKRAAPKPPARVLSFASPESSNITGATYDPETQQVIVTFYHGKSYAYFSVPDIIWDEFVAADSKGVYFTAHLKDIYSCQKL